MRNLPPPIFLLLIALMMLGCESDRTDRVGSLNAAAVLDPARCGPDQPTCAEAIDFPTSSDLTISNSANLAVYGGGLQLIGGSGNIVDSDGDGVPDPADDCPGPGWRTPCDGDATNDGLYQTTYYGGAGQYTLGADINVDGKIRTADVYILMDATGSMVGEQKQLIEDLIRGTFVDPGDCGSASDTGLVGALSCVVDDVWMGLGQFNEYPLKPHGHAYRYAPYHHHLDVTDNLGHLLDAVSALTTTFNRDHPEAASQAMYSVATGQGIGPWVPNRRGCPAGRWGYPCFRPGALPVIMLFTDAEIFNGPRTSSPRYRTSDFGSLGDSTLLPPLEQDPGMIYANDALSAYNLGDLSNKSVSVMGTNVKFANSFRTWPEGDCRRCSDDKGCWGDGYDGVVRFEVDEDFEDDNREAYISSIGTFYPTANIALLDSSLSYLDCDGGPGNGNYWGWLRERLGQGTWFAVNDAGVAQNSSAASRKGPFQIRIQTTSPDSSWATKDAPIPWTDVETEILARAIKIVSIVSPGDNGLVAGPDADALGIVTGSVDQSGDPYRSTIAGDGTGLSTGILDAVRALVGDTRRDITVIAEDNPATAVDESRFVDAVVATQCPTTGINNCLGGQGTDTCEGCLADTALSFEFRVGNDFLTPDPFVDQVFDFDLISLADGSVELNRIPVRVMVPAGGINFGEGFYQNTYDAYPVCDMSREERPDWFELTWEGETPDDSSIEFQFFTGNTLEELENQLPTSVTVTDATPSIRVGQEITGDSKMNYLPYLKVRARLRASTDGGDTPLLEGWTMQFNCVVEI